VRADFDKAPSGWSFGKGNFRAATIDGAGNENVVFPER
jgi:hypothetical protein